MRNSSILCFLSYCFYAYLVRRSRPLLLAFTSGRENVLILFEFFVALLECFDSKPAGKSSGDEKYSKLLIPVSPNFSVMKIRWLFMKSPPMVDVFFALLLSSKQTKCHDTSCPRCFQALSQKSEWGEKQLKRNFHDLMNNFFWQAPLTHVLW